jgi:oligopeptide/dipeptide ABC transporter ATP-binding protein
MIIRNHHPDNPMSRNDLVLEIDDLRVSFHTEEGEAPAVDGVSLRMRRGRVTALVGESGCGKSVTSYAILRLIQKPGRVTGGSIRYYGKDGEIIDITALDEQSDRLYSLRGGRIGLIFQEPMTALSPVHTVGDQIGEAIMLHRRVTEQEARLRAIDTLRRVGIPGPEKRVDQYPFEMSGGMRQRVVIAMALACEPDLLIADEPTTALDVTIQAQIMSLLKTLQRDTGVSILLITHDLGVVAQMADDVAVMYLGRIVERADVRTIMKHPGHPYTIGLLQSLPGLSGEGRRLQPIRGGVPSMTAIPPGCPFHPRCRHSEPGLCDRGMPPSLETLEEGHQAACFRIREIGDRV